MRKYDFERQSQQRNSLSPIGSGPENRIDEYRGGVRDYIGWAIVGTIVVGVLAFADVQVAVHVVSIFVLYVAGRLLLKRKT